MFWTDFDRLSQAVTYSVLIGAAGKALNLDLAFDYYEQLKVAAQYAKENPSDDDEGRNNAVEVGTVTYINLISACDMCGQLDRTANCNTNANFLEDDFLLEMQR